jgi:hypothetical protein
MKDTDNNVYVKRGNKYTPFGLRYNEQYLPDGIWFVRHYDHSYGTTNVDHYLSGLYKVGETPEMIDIPKLCSMHTYVEYVMASPEFREIMDKGSYSFQELVSKITALILKLNKTLKARDNDDNKGIKRHSGSF